MKIKTLSVLVLIMIVTFAASSFAQELSKDEWQKQMNEQTTKRDNLQSRLNNLSTDIANLKSQSSKLDADLLACEDELFKLLGVTREQFEAFGKELERYEKRTDEFMRMSDAELLQYADEIGKMAKRVDEMLTSKMAKLPRFADRLSSLKSKIQSLLNTLAKSGATYTVGTWAKDRDCLWNIAKKPKVYGNAWLWPKIWQGNKDKIKDPDIIKPGWILKIPAGKELTKDEKSAANSYYRKKGGK